MLRDRFTWVNRPSSPGPGPASSGSAAGTWCRSWSGAKKVTVGSFLVIFSGRLKYVAGNYRYGIRPANVTIPDRYTDICTGDLQQPKPLNPSPRSPVLRSRSLLAGVKPVNFGPAPAPPLRLQNLWNWKNWRKKNTFYQIRLFLYQNFFLNVSEIGTKMIVVTAKYFFAKFWQKSNCTGIKKFCYCTPVLRSRSRSRSHPEPPFFPGARAGAGAAQKGRLRLRLQVHKS